MPVGIPGQLRQSANVLVRAWQDVHAAAFAVELDHAIHQSEQCEVLPLADVLSGVKAGAYLPGGEFTFTYRTRAGAANLGYRVEVSTDLVTWDQTGTSVEVLSQSPQPDGALVIVARLLPDKETGNGVQSRFARVGFLQ